MNTPTTLDLPANSGVPSLEHLKASLRPQDCINELEWVESKIKQAILLNDTKFLCKNNIDALKLHVDIQRIKLSKILPDVKAMEHGMGDSNGKVQFVINLGSGANMETNVRTL